MGYPQHKRTMATTGNITAQGHTMGTMTPKASKSMDQRFHWLKCCHAQQQFLYLWYGKGGLHWRIFPRIRKKKKIHVGKKKGTHGEGKRTTCTTPKIINFCSQPHQRCVTYSPRHIMSEFNYP
jgi:hypothetical protein